MKTSILVSVFLCFSIICKSCSGHRKTKTETFKIISYNIWIGYQDGESKRLPLYHSGDKLMSEARFWGHEYAVTLRDKGMAVGFSSKYPIEVKEILTEGMHHGLIYCTISGIDVSGYHFVALVEIDSRGIIRITGRESSWVGPDPWEVGYAGTHKEKTSSRISSRELEF